MNADVFPLLSRRDHKMSTLSVETSAVPVAVPLAPAPKTSFRPDIEGLRAIAVLLVVLYHAKTPGCHGGFVGVDVFFVLSGYLITGLLFEELVKTDRISFIRFYARRVRRLLPASAFTILATIAAVHVLLSPLEQIKLVRTALSTVSYVSNFYFAQSTRDYFGNDNAGNPFLHTWSLAVEEQFYCLWPLLLFFAYRVKRSRSQVAGFLAALSAISLAYCIWFTRESQAAAFFMSPARAWEFGVGGLLSLIPARLLLPYGRVSRILGYVGLSGILVAAYVFSSETHFPGYAALLPALATGTALIAGAGAPGQGIGRFLKLRPFQLFGELSYSVYLWHWPMLVLAASQIEQFTAAKRLVCVCAAVLIATVMHYLIENPIRFSRSLTPHPRLCVALAGVLTAVSLCGVLYWRHTVKALPQYAKYAQAANDEPRLYEMGCSAGFTEEKVRECNFGKSQSDTRIVLLGDSHAAQWAPALESIVNRRSWSLTTFIKNACPAVSVPAFNPRFGGYEQECARWREQALQRIVALRPALVILGSRSWYSKHAGKGVEPLSYEDWRDGTARMLDPLSKAGITVLVMGDAPRPGFDVPDCLARAAWKGVGHCGPFHRVAGPSDVVLRAEQEATQQFAAASVLDPSGNICNGQDCDVTRNGIIFYRDKDHLTATFAKSLEPMLASRIEAMPFASASEKRQ